MNGIVQQYDSQTLQISVVQSFGNCSRYIVPRIFPTHPNTSKVETKKFTTWHDDVLDWISIADTFFIASSSRDKSKGLENSVDISHRGGSPGFISLDSKQRLVVPDYSGNNFFNTMGNIHLNPQAGLLFIDFAKGHALQLTVHAEIIWEKPGIPIDPETKRALRFTLIKGRIFYGALKKTF